MRLSRKRSLFLSFGIALAAATLVAAAAGHGAAATSSKNVHASGKLTLKIWDIFYFPKQAGAAGALGRAEKKIDTLYMKKYPQVTVKHVGVPGTDFFTDLRKFVASRQGPDVVTNGGGSFSANQGFIKALYPMYKLITPKMKQQIGPYLKGESIGDAAHYSIPNVAGVYAFYYNKALFAKAGIKAAPTSFTSLLGDCHKLSAAGITPISNGFTGLAGDDLFYYGTSSLMLNAKQLVKWANFKIGWTQPQIVSALKAIDTMAAANCFGNRANAATVSDTDGQSAFMGGRGAMLFSSNLGSASFKGQLPVSRIGVFAFPHISGAPWPSGTPDSGYNGNWSIMNYTKVCRAAWNYIAFYDTPRSQAIQWKVGGLLPINTAAKVRASNALDGGLLKLAANKYGHHGVGATISSPEAGTLGHLMPELVAGSLAPTQLASQMQTSRSTVHPTPATKLPKPPPCVNGQSVAH